MNLNLSENLKNLRKEKGDTQEKLGEFLGVTPQTVSRWELGICYPDLELLPSIANYFGVTTDTLLSNDDNSIEKDRKAFYEKVYTLQWENSTEQIDFVREYCRKYPGNYEYAYRLVCSICDYACGNEARTNRFMPLMLKTVEALLETQYRNAAIEKMIILCPEHELENWLNLTPYASGFSRRSCLIYRASNHNDRKGSYIQQGLRMIETLAEQLDSRCPDSLGAKQKEKYQREILRTVESFGTEGEIPDGWKMFYAYKQLVLAACLFGEKKIDEGWNEFDSAIDKIKYIYSIDDEWLSIGGALFSDLKVSKDWNYAIDTEGNKHKLFATIRLSYYRISTIYNLLTNSRWAWFNVVRNTEKYRDVVAWAEQIKQEQKKK